MSFDHAVAFVLKWEGGLVDDPNDPGGLTKYGISKRAHPGEDIANLTVARATEIYRFEYWLRARCEQMPWPVALGVFDMAVNAGVRAAIRCLQRAVGEADDGIYGPRTDIAVNGRDPVRVARDVAVERVRYYSALPGWARYGHAWTKRTVDAVVASVTASGLAASEPR